MKGLTAIAGFTMARLMMCHTRTGKIEVAFDRRQGGTRAMMRVTPPQLGQTGRSALVW